jgi:hypothetical protein
MVRVVFERSYKQEEAPVEEGPTLATTNTASKVHAPCSPKNKADVCGHGQALSKPKNMFDNLPSLTAPTWKELWDELDRYLSTDPEIVEEVLMWWHEHRGMYPCLSRMALDYLTIPGMPSLGFHTYLSTNPLF